MTTRGRKAINGAALSAAERKRLSRDRQRQAKSLATSTEFRDTAEFRDTPTPTPCHEIQPPALVLDFPAKPAAIRASSSSAPASEFRDTLGPGSYVIPGQTAPECSQPPVFGLLIDWLTLRIPVRMLPPSLQERLFENLNTVVCCSEAKGELFGVVSENGK